MQIVIRVPDVWQIIVQRSRSYTSAIIQYTLEACQVPARRFTVANLSNSYAFNLSHQMDRIIAHFLLKANDIFRRRLYHHGYDSGRTGDLLAGTAP
jgi:hypothetical protein